MAALHTSREAYESKLYYEFSHLYDKSFGLVFANRIRRVIRSLRIPPGAHVLELGVGTGASFKAYPRHCEVTGVDLAPHMLDHARSKLRTNGWRHIRVREMDAMNLEFPDSSFDYVMAFHVVSVVPDAGRLMREAERVCRAGGSIVVINHFRSPKPFLAALDRRIEPITRRCGWRTLEKEEVFEGSSLEITRSWKMPRRSLFTIVIARKQEEYATLAAQASVEACRAAQDAEFHPAVASGA